MTATLAPDTIEAVDLEVLFGELAPCDWTRGHHATGVPCAGPAVALAWATCNPAYRVRACESARGWFESIRASDLPCGACNRPAVECWRVIPI